MAEQRIRFWFSQPELVWAKDVEDPSETEEKNVTRSDLLGHRRLFPDGWVCKKSFYIVQLATHFCLIVMAS